jgi:hypothetical protein
MITTTTPNPGERSCSSIVGMVSAHCDQACPAKSKVLSKGEEVNATWGRQAAKQTADSNRSRCRPNKGGPHRHWQLRICSSTLTALRITSASPTISIKHVLWTHASRSALVIYVVILGKLTSSQTVELISVMHWQLARRSETDISSLSRTIEVLPHHRGLRERHRLSWRRPTVG